MRLTAPLQRLSALVLLALIVAVGAGCDNGPEAETDVRVMTRNLYLGGDLFALLDPSCEDQIPVCVADLYFGSVVTSDIPGRMGAVAAEIAANDPDLIGLQEVTLYRTQSPGDYVTGTTTPNATNVTFDFLEILLDSLEARGLAYEVVATNTNADVELPSTFDGQNFTDIRLTDRDVILARSGLSTSVVREYNFDPLLTAVIPIGGVDVAFTRGFSAVEVTKEGVTFTFGNAHLEVGGEAAAAQRAQAGYLAGNNGLGGTAPLILLGDFNADPDADPAGEEDAYEVLTDAFTDAWPIIRSGESGETCCHDADLRNDTPDLNSRIDLVLFAGDVTPSMIGRVGEEAGDQTTSGVWPSDHAGVVATLRVRQ